MTISTAIIDYVPSLRNRKSLLTISIGIGSFIVGLTCVTRSGQYVIRILDYYGTEIPFLLIAITEVIGLMWVYGFESFTEDLLSMTKHRLGLFWMITLKYAAPITLTAITIYSFVIHEPLRIDSYQYPAWAEELGWTLTLLVVGHIPLWAAIEIIRQSGSDWNLKIKQASSPDNEWMMNRL